MMAWVKTRPIVRPLGTGVATPSSRCAVLVTLAFFVLRVTTAAAAGPPAQAKAPGTIIYSDNFASVAPGWGKPTSHRFVQNGQFVMQVAANDVDTDTNTDLQYRQETTRADIRVDFVQTNAATTAADGGLIFWASDPDNRYELLIGGGSFTVAKLAGGKFSSLIKWTNSSALKSEDEALNRIEVVDEGNSAYFLINGQNVGHIAAPTATSGDSIGFICVASDRTPTICRFSNLSVAVASAKPPAIASSPKIIAPPNRPEVAPTAQTSPSTPGRPAQSTAVLPAFTAINSDDFRTMAQRWGRPNHYAYVKDRSLRLHPHAHHEYLLLNRVLDYRQKTPHADISAVVTSQRANDLNDYAGLVFWAKDPHNEYEFVIGKTAFAVARNVNGKYTFIIGWTPSNARESPKTRQIAVDVVDEGDAAYFEINGKLVGHIRAPQKMTGNQIGLSCGAGRTSNFCSFSRLSVKVAVDESSFAPRPGDVIFDDDFAAITPGWGKTDQHVSFRERKGQPSQFQIHTAADRQWWLIRSDLHYKRNGTPRVDISVTASEQDKTNVHAASGLIFWAKDGDNFYEFLVGNGQYGVFRRRNGKFVTIIPWTKAAGWVSKQWPNTFGLTDEDHNAYVWIGSMIVGLIPAPTPRPDDRVGIVCLSDAAAPNVCTYSDFKLSVVPVSPSVPPLTGSMIFSDNFKAANQNWGAPGTAGGGVYRMHAVAGQSKAALNQSLHYRQQTKSADIRVDMALPGPPIKNTYGGLIFWAKDAKNYYSFMASDSGFWVNRILNGKDKTIVNGSDKLGTHYDDTVMNQIEVIDRGNEADFLVNGTSVGHLPAPAHLPGDLIGLNCGAGNRGSGECAFANLTATALAKTNRPRTGTGGPAGNGSRAAAAGGSHSAAGSSSHPFTTTSAGEPDPIKEAEEALAKNRSKINWNTDYKATELMAATTMGKVPLVMFFAGPINVDAIIYSDAMVALKHKAVFLLVTDRNPEAARLRQKFGVGDTYPTVVIMRCRMVITVPGLHGKYRLDSRVIGKQSGGNEIKFISRTLRSAQALH